MILTYKDKIDNLNGLRVYLAGPIFGKTGAEANDWREEVMTSCPDFTFANPMNRDYRGKEDESVDEIVNGDKLDIGRSNILLANTQSPSAGTSMEIYYAWDANMPVIAIGGERVSPWIRYHSDCVVSSVEEAIKELKRIHYSFISREE